MSLYLAFLAGMLLLVAVVYLPGRIADGLSWLVRPRTLVAVGLLAVPATLVFWWFERHGHGVPAAPRGRAPRPPVGAADQGRGRVRHRLRDARACSVSR